MGVFYKQLHLVRKEVAKQLRSSDFCKDSLCFDSVFSVSECEKIIETGLCLDRREGKIGKKQVDWVKRRSGVRWLPFGDEHMWIFERLEGIIHEINRQTYRFRIFNFQNEQLQFTEYSSSEHYNWHKDIGIAENSLRKLSMSIQLSPENSYTGGNIEFFGPKIISATRTQGTMIIFPSYLYHRVTPVDSGTRYSLVGWMNGPSFR